MKRANKLEPRPLKTLLNDPEPSIMELLEGCLQFDPSKRLTAEQLLKLPVFNEARIDTDEFNPESTISCSMDLISKENDYTVSQLQTFICYTV